VPTKSKRNEETIAKELHRKRTKSGVSPVIEDKMPMWFRKQVRAVAKVIFPADKITLPSESLLFNILERLNFIAEFTNADGLDYTELFDHPGATSNSADVIAGRRRTPDDDEMDYVLEPYPYCEKRQYQKDLAIMTRDLSLVFGCIVDWDTKSWHYPGHTYRISFSKFKHEY